VLPDSAGFRFGRPDPGSLRGMARVGRGTRPLPRGFLLRPILHPTRGAPGGDAAPHRPPVGVRHLHPDDPREVERDAPRKSEGSEGLEEHEDPIVEGARNYQRAFKREFYTNYQPISVHIRDIRLSGKVHNNIYDALKGCCSLSPLRFHQEAGTHLFEDLPHFPDSPLRGALPTQNDEDLHPHVVVQGDSSS
jgi:hypothetical protein